jgi:hypothetical protein
MAQLKIDIEVNDNGAEQKIKAIGKAVDDVDQPAKRAGASLLQFSSATKMAEGSVQKATETFSQFHARLGGDTVSAMQAFVRQGANVEQAAASLSQETLAATSAQSALAGGLGLSTEALGASTVAMSGLGAAIVLASTAAGAILAILVDSAKAYFEQSEAMQGARTELQRLNDTWHDFKMIVGEAILGGEGDAIVSLFRLAERAVLDFAVRLGAAIEMYKEFLGLNTAGAAVSMLDAAVNGPGALPNVAPPKAFQAQAPNFGAAGPAELAQVEQQLNQQIAAKQRAAEESAKAMQRLVDSLTGADLNGRPSNSRRPSRSSRSMAKTHPRPCIASRMKRRIC